MAPTTTRTNPLSYLTDQLNDLKQRGTYFKLRVLEDEQAPECTFDGKRVINLASNNYLGLTTHPKLREAALAATKKYGVGSGAVRTIAGTMTLHMELEEKIARFKNVEACVVFQSGFTANAGTVSGILGKEDFIVSDELNHASSIGLAVVSAGTATIYYSNNPTTRDWSDPGNPAKRGTWGGRRQRSSAARDCSRAPITSSSPTSSISLRPW